MMRKSFKELWSNYKKLFKEAFKDLKTKGRRHKQIPNILTVTRLIAAPCFIIPAAMAGNVYLIALFTIIFSLTDAVDGYIARKYNCISELGKDLDATSDKVFASSLLIAESFFNPIILFNLIFELIIGAINVKEKFTGATPRSLYIGKIKTCFLYPLIIVGFIIPFYDKLMPLFNTLLVATTSLQTVTVASYIIRYEKDKTDNIEDTSKDKEKEKIEIEEPVDTKKKKKNKVIEEVKIINNIEEVKENIENMHGLMEYELDYNKKVEEKQKAKTKKKVLKK